MKDKPTSIRIPQDVRARLAKVAKRSNTPATEIMLLGLIRFLDEHRTTDAVIEAVVRGRQARSREVAA